LSNRRCLLLDPGEAVVRSDIFDLTRAIGLEPVLATQRITWERNGVELWVEADPSDARQVFAALADRHIGVDAVFNCREPYVITAAIIAEKNGLPGVPTTAAYLCRDKVLMRERLLPAGLPMARHYTITSADDLVVAAREIGFPAVLKPSSGSGSKSTIRCQSFEDAVSWFERFSRDVAESPNPLFRHMRGQWLLEENLDGGGYSVESIVINDKPAHIAVCEKGPMAPPFFREVGHSIPPRVPHTVLSEMLRLTTCAIEVLGVKHSTTHTEFKLTSAGIRILEVGARIGGGSIRQVVYHATGLDLLELGLRLAAGQDVAVTSTVRQAAASRSLYPPTEGKLRRLAGLDNARSMPGVVHINEWLEPGQFYGLPPRSYGEVVGIVAVANDALSAVKRATSALNAVQPEWESGA